MIGIYKITCNVNGRVYIGQSKNIGQRWNNHINRLECGKHYNKFLQEDFINYGYNNFTFEIIKECKENELLDLEKKFIDIYEVDCYNFKGNDKNNYKHYKLTKSKNHIRININIWKHLFKMSSKISQHITIVAYSKLDNNNVSNIGINYLSKFFNVTKDAIYKYTDKILNDFNNSKIFKSAVYSNGYFCLEFNDEFTLDLIDFYYPNTLYRNMASPKSLGLYIYLLKYKELTFKVDDAKILFNLTSKQYEQNKRIREMFLKPVARDFERNNYKLEIDSNRLYGSIYEITLSII